MSLVRIACRIAAAEAIKGRTLVGDNVLDSEIGALDVDASGELKSLNDTPFIAIYTDSATMEGEDIAQRAFVLNGRTLILFELGITAAMVETDPDTDERKLLGAGIPVTDHALEFHLDLVARQIGDALTDPANEWGQIFMSFIRSFRNVERSRVGAAGDKGVKLAGHQMRITAEMVADPVKGEPLNPASPMAKFLAKAATLDDSAMTTQIAAIEAAISGTIHDWQLPQRRYGMTTEEMDAMLLSAQPGAEADIAAVDIDTAPAEPVQP